MELQELKEKFEEDYPGIFEVIKKHFGKGGYTSMMIFFLNVLQPKQVSVEPVVILPSKQEIKEHVIKSFGTDGSLRFSQMPDDDQERVRMNAEYFRYGAEWAVSKARSK